MSIPLIVIVLFSVIEEHEPITGGFVFLMFFNFIGGIYLLKQGLNDLKNINAIYDRKDIDYIDKRRMVGEYYEINKNIDRAIMRMAFKGNNKSTSVVIECPYCGCTHFF